MTTYIPLWVGVEPTAGTVDGSAYEMGTRFTVNSTLTCYGVRVWNPGLAPTYSRNVHIWTDAGASVYSQGGYTITAAGFTNLIFTTPQVLAPGIYLASVNINGGVATGNTDYGAVSGAAQINYGPAVANPTNFDWGRFNTAVNLIPNQSFGNAYYGINPLIGIATDGAGSSVTLSQPWTKSTTASGTSKSVTLAGAAAAGDVILCAVATDAVITTPIGYTRVIGNVSTLDQALFAKIAAGGETSVAFTIASSQACMAAACVVHGLNGASIAAMTDQTKAVASTTATHAHSGETELTTAGDTFQVAMISVHGASITGDLYSNLSNGFASVAEGFFTQFGGSAGRNVLVATKNAHATGYAGCGVQHSQTIASQQGLVASFKLAPTIYVKSRAFNGTSDDMAFAVAESTGNVFMGPGTVAICLQRTRDSAGGPGGGYQAFFSGEDSGGNPHHTSYFDPSDYLYVYNLIVGNSNYAVPTLKTADGWAVAAVSNSGTATRGHLFKWSTATWSHADFGAFANANGSLASTDVFRVGAQGNWNQLLAANVAVVAYWHRTLSDAEINTLNTSLAAWTALSPNHLWRMDASTVVDSVGTSNIAYVHGTSLTGLDSPLLVGGVTAPDQVTGLTAGTVTTTTVPLTWTAPANGGSAITDYLVEYSLNGTSWSTFSHTASTATSQTVTGLTSGTLYYFRVSAVNAIGTGTASATQTATTITPSYSDDFNRANGGLGSNWVDYSLTSGMVIASNAVVPANATDPNGTADAVYVTPLPTFAAFSEMTFSCTNPTNADMRVAVLVDVTQQGFLAMQFTGNNSTIRFREYYVENGSGITRASATLTMAAATSYLLRIEVSAAGVVDGYVNGAKVLTYTLNPASYGRRNVGFSMGGTVTGDNWRAGTPSVTGGTGFKLGAVDVTAMKVGSTAVSKLMAGSVQVWPVTFRSIATENALTGDAPAGWFSTTSFDANIRGFATAMSVEVGTNLSFKVDSSSTAYTIDIYRLGWYAGNGARKIATLSGSAVTQPDGTLRTSGEGGTGSRDCSNWTVTNTWNVPPDATHGWHLAVLKRTGQSAFNYGGMFVVTNDRNRAAKIKIKSSDMTWQAYNQWGTMAAPTTGRGVYGSTQGVFSQGLRSWDVSYDRPLGVLPVSSDVTMVPQTHPFNGELPIWSWMERNGYDVGYVTGLDLEKGSMSLAGAQVVVSAGHDEYWSDNIRSAWDGAIAGGAHGIVFSGNTLLWRTRMGTGTDARRIYCYKNSHSLDGTGAGIDPVTWTGTWRDPRWASRDPECRSIGSSFIANGIRADRIEIPFAYKDNVIWRNTTIPSLTSGNKVQLKADVLGMEWDTYTTYYANSMMYPPRTALLSEATVDLSNNTAAEGGSIYSNTVPGGLVKHYITASPTAVGKLLVNFGVNQWGWGLNDFHCRGTTGVDANMQQATINLLADMGQQPTTIQSGVTAATQTAWTWPTIVSLAVAPSSTSVYTGNTQQLTAMATWSNGITTDVTKFAAWSSGATGISTVGAATGIVTGVTVGSATITAAYLGQNGTCSVTVLAALQHVWTGATPVADTSDNGTYEMGTAFSMVVASMLRGARIWNPGGISIPRKIHLWGAGGTQLNEWACPSQLTAGWNDIPLSPTASLSTGISYVLSYNVHGPNDYGAVVPPGWPKNNGTFSLDDGRYATTAGSYPAGAGNPFYGVDVLY